MTQHSPDQYFDQILGDGDGWIPETTLAPGESLRLWTVDVGGSPLLVTLHPPVGGDLTSAADDLDLLLAGLALRPA